MSDRDQRNADARRLLEQMRAAHDDDPTVVVMFSFDQAEPDGFSALSFEHAAELLVRRSFAERVAMDSYRITDEGIDADDEELNGELPVSEKSNAQVDPSLSLASKVFDNNKRARTLLEFLANVHVDAAGRNVSVPRDYPPLIELLGSRDNVGATFRMLVDKNLAVWAGQSMRVTQLGVDLCLDEELDRALPIEPRLRRAYSVPPQTVEALEFITGASLHFVKDPSLTTILRRDLGELEQAITGGLWKCTAILAGSIVEGLLLDVLGRRTDLAKGYFPKTKFPEETSLGQLVDIAKAEGLLDDPAPGLVGHLRDFRDLVHPDRERRTGVKVDAGTGHALIALLRLVVRDLANEAQVSIFVNK